MIQFSPIIGTLVASTRSTIYRNRRREGKKPQNLAQGTTYTKIPLPLYADLLQHPPAHYDKVDLYILRRCFQYADSIYHHKSPTERLEWKHAVTRPRTSAYDLWMKEAMTLLLQAKRPPDHPSLSGGWSTTKVVEGDDHTISPCFPPPRMWKHTLRPHDNQTGLPPGWRRWTWRWHSDGTPPRPNTQMNPQARWGWMPDLQKWYQAITYIRYDIDYVVTLRIDHLPYLYWDWAYYTGWDEVTRHFRGQNCFIVPWVVDIPPPTATWPGNCPESNTWEGPPPRTYPLPPWP